MEPKHSNRSDRKKEETQTKIFEVSVTLFNQMGIENVTMEMIAEKVDIAKGTLYNYFPSKEAIINGYLQRSFQESSQERLAQIAQLPDTSTRLKYVFSLLIEGVKRQQEIFESFMLFRMKNTLSFHPVGQDQATGLSSLSASIIQLGTASGELDSRLDARLLEDLFELALIEVIKPYYIDPHNFQQEKAISQAIDLFLHGAALRK
ncbi:MAG: TetR/AcrR family transcriptional regulator [Anaerolineaceae bacterium]|nr:TetR/AcrR family transcriptional regulator [Anaerolineaceae bacterium]